MKIILILLFSLIVSILSVPDATHILYYNRLVGPNRNLLQAFGNYNLEQYFAFNDYYEMQFTKTAIDKIIENYYPSQFPYGPKYILQYYKDSSLSTVLYILYKQLNHTHTYKYHYLRYLDNSQTNMKERFLGVGICQKCRPGIQMPLFQYSKLSVENNVQFASKLVDKANQARNSSDFALSNILELKFWSFPKGMVFVMRNKNKNNSNTFSSFLIDDKNNIYYINSSYAPQYVGNIPIDNVYLNYYLNSILKVSVYVSYHQRNTYGTIVKTHLQKRNTSQIRDIIFFEYFIDPQIKAIGTYMLNLKNSVFTIYNSPYTRIFGNFHTHKDYNNNLTTVEEFNYNKPQQNPYFNRNYFHNNDDPERMTNNLPIGQSQLIVRDLYRTAKSRLYSLKRIILFTKNIYVTIGNIEPDNQTYAYVYIQDKRNRGLKLESKYSYLGMMPHNNPVDVPIRANANYQYRYIAALNALFSNPMSRALSYPSLSAQSCFSKDQRFELYYYYHYLYQHSISVLNYYMVRYVLLKDISTDRKFYLGWEYVNKDQINLLNYYWPAKRCHDSTFVIVNTNEVNNLYNEIKQLLVDTQGRTYQSKEITNVLLIYTYSQVYVIDVLKDGIVSNFIINCKRQHNVKPKYSITAYTQNVKDPQEKQNYFSRTVVNSNNGLNLNFKPYTGEPSNTKSNDSSVSTTNSTVNTGNNSSLNRNTTTNTQSNGTNSTNPLIGSGLNSTNNSLSTSNNSNISQSQTIIANQKNIQVISIVDGKNIIKFKKLLNGKLDLTKLKGQYLKLLQLIKENDSFDGKRSIPLLNYYVDKFDKVIVFRISFTNLNNIIFNYYFLKMIDTNKYSYLGKQFQKDLSLGLKLNQKQKFQGQIKSQIQNIIKSNPKIINPLIRFINISSISIINTKCYFIDTILDKGFTVNIILLQQGESWQRIYVNVIQQNQNISGIIKIQQPSQSNAITYKTLNQLDINSDTYVVPVYNYLMSNFANKINRNSRISKIQRGQFKNKTIAYKFLFVAVASYSCPQLVEVIIFVDTLKKMAIYVQFINILENADLSQMNSINRSIYNQAVNNIIRLNRSLHPETIKYLHYRLRPIALVGKYAYILFTYSMTKIIDNNLQNMNQLLQLNRQTLEIYELSFK